MKRGWQRGLLAAVAGILIGVAPMRAATAQQAATPARPAPPFSGTSVTHANAVVFAIDTRRNSMTLLQENGEPVDVVVDRNVGDVARLRLGDTVAVTFNRALLLRAEKSNTNGIRERVDKGFTTGASLGASLAVHRVEAVVTVVRIDRGKHQLTLRGPTRTVVLQASSDGLLDGLQAGDSVRVDYVEATAVRIMRDGAPVR